LVIPPAKPGEPVHSNRLRFHVNTSTGVRPPITSVPRTRPMSSARVATLKSFADTRNRRYAAVLSRLNKQASVSPRLSSAAFSGYVPKCRQNGTEQSIGVVTPVTVGVVERSAAEQHIPKVSFSLESVSSQGKKPRGRKASFRRAVTASPAVSVKATVTLTSSEALTLTNSSLPVSSVPSSTITEPVVSSAVTDPMINVASGQVPSDGHDISLLCEELFVADNRFCDWLLEESPLRRGEPTAPKLAPDCSLLNSSKKDIPEPVTNFSFEDFVELEELFGCN